ncbi:hypothetical protein MCOR01_009971 [Pyricularia oryzae]|nr:hypothetical protein MCOR01_009971 [Pyricularia oryzae]
MTGTQVPISHPNREDDNFILFGGSPLAPGHRGEQVGQPQGRGHQQDQQRSSGPVGRSLFYQTNLLLLETHSALLFDALHKTNRTQENRHDISELEKTVRSLRQVMANQDYAPLVYHVDGRITTPTRPWIHRWRDLQGGYHVTPYEPPNTNPAGYPYQHRADGAQPLRQVAKDLDWQLHSNLRRYLPDMEWCVVCGNWHYVQEARSVDILLWEAFGDENGLLPDEYPIDGQVMQLPSLPMCLEWAQFWDWGIIGLVPGRTPGSWMTKVVHPDFIQFMASNYPGAEGREINVSSSWQPNPRHLYLRWAVTELLRIHDEGVARPVAPARGVLSWENGIADYETGPLGCDMTMMVTWLGYELAGLAPEETCALFDIPEELEQRAKDQLNMEWARQFWTPRFKRFIDAYLGWNAVVSKELAQYRQQMGISPGVSRVDDGEADQRLREVLGRYWRTRMRSHRLPRSRLWRKTRTRRWLVGRRPVRRRSTRRTLRRWMSRRRRRRRLVPWRSSRRRRRSRVRRMRKRRATRILRNSSSSKAAITMPTSKDTLMTGARRKVAAGTRPPTTGTGSQPARKMMVLRASATSSKL